MPDSDYSGSYRVTRVEGVGPFGAFSEASFTVDITAITNTQRQFDFTYLPDIGGFAQSFEFDLICDKTLVLRHSTGIGCGAGSIVWASGGESTEFDIDDDSSFTLKFMDFVEDGGCGVPAYPVTFEFEKI